MNYTSILNKKFLYLILQGIFVSFILSAQPVISGKVNVKDTEKNLNITPYGFANTVGNIFFGSKGYMLKDVSGWQTFMGKERKPGESGKGEGNHYQNFIDAIRANDPSKLTAPIDEGFYSCALIHLANISYRLGRTLNIDTENFKVINDIEANQMFTKEYRKPYLFPNEI